MDMLTTWLEQNSSSENRQTPTFMWTHHPLQTASEADQKLSSLWGLHFTGYLFNSYTIRRYGISLLAGEQL